MFVFVVLKTLLFLGFEFARCVCCLSLVSSLCSDDLATRVYFLPYSLALVVSLDLHMHSSVYKRFFSFLVSASLELGALILISFPSLVSCSYTMHILPLICLCLSILLVLYEVFYMINTLPSSVHVFKFVCKCGFLGDHFAFCIARRKFARKEIDLL